jgi:hypothetical protein
LGAGFEALGRREVFGPLHGDRGDHGTACQERRQDVQEVLLPVEHADSRGSEHLVPGEHGKVHVQLFDVQRHVRSRLAGVQYHQGAGFPAEGREFTDRVDGAQDVGGMREGKYLCPAVHGVPGHVHAEAAVVVHRDVPQGRPGAEGQLLPGYEVGVVLHFGHHDFVTRVQGELLEPGVAPALGSPQPGVGQGVAEEVQALGGVGSPDDL